MSKVQPTVLQLFEVRYYYLRGKLKSQIPRLL